MDPGDTERERGGIGSRCIFCRNSCRADTGSEIYSEQPQGCRVLSECARGVVARGQGGGGATAARLARGIGARGSPGTGGRGASGSCEDAGSGGGAGLRIREVGASAWARREAGRTVEWRWGAGDPGGRRRARDGPYPKPALNSCLLSLQLLVPGIFRPDWSDFSCHDFLVLSS